MDKELEPNLILHKVRGLPAFDIACLIGFEEDGTEMWIIPTSGHRAYPYFTTPLSDMQHMHMDPVCFMDFVPTMPESWPDHYACNNPSTSLTESGANLLDRLGLTQKVERRF